VHRWFDALEPTREVSGPILRGWRSRCIKELVRPAVRCNCKVHNMRLRCIITSNALLILKMWDIIFLRANYIMAHFKGFFQGAKNFLTPKIVPSAARDNLGVKSS
jgi:hypothetical protein